MNEDWIVVEGRQMRGWGREEKRKGLDNMAKGQRVHQHREKVTGAGAGIQWKSLV